MLNKKVRYLKLFKLINLRKKLIATTNKQIFYLPIQNLENITLSISSVDT